MSSFDQVATNPLAEKKTPTASLESRYASWLFSRVAFPLMRRFSGITPLVIYYHLVNDQEVPHVSGLYSFRTVREFTKDLDALLKTFRPAALQDFLGSLNGRQSLPPNSFLLTFDDGLRECYDIVAPILKAKGIPATFFLCSAFVDNKELAYDHKKCLIASQLARGRWHLNQETEVRSLLAKAGIREPDLIRALLSVDYQRKSILDPIAAVVSLYFSEYLKTREPYMTSPQIQKLLAMGHSIGAHSIDHPRYSTVTLQEQLHQTVTSIGFVKERFGVAYRAFSFPSSDAQVSRDFFAEILEKGVADICFGNQGLLDDPIARNVQRTSMEKTWMPAEAILGKTYARRLTKRFIGQSVVRRNQHTNLSLTAGRGFRDNLSN